MPGWRGLVGKDHVAGGLRAALRSLENAQEVAGNPSLARMRTRPLQARIEGRELAAHRLERQAHGDVGMLQKPPRIARRQRAERERRRRAVDEADASLAPRSKSGLKPAFAMASRAGMRRPR